MSSITFKIDITPSVDSTGNPLNTYTPFLTYTDNGKETPIECFDTFELKYSSAGKGAGLKANVRMQSIVNREGKFEIAKQVYELPTDIKTIIEASTFLKEKAIKVGPKATRTARKEAEQLEEVIV